MIHSKRVFAIILSCATLLTFFAFSTVSFADQVTSFSESGSVDGYITSYNNELTSDGCADYYMYYYGYTRSASSYYGKTNFLFYYYFPTGYNNVQIVLENETDAPSSRTAQVENTVTHEVFTTVSTVYQLTYYYKFTDSAVSTSTGSTVYSRGDTHTCYMDYHGYLVMT